MNRQRLHLAVDITMFLCGLGVVATGMLIYFVLPPGSHGDSVWGLTRHDWGDWHFYIALALLGMVLLHLLLNWNWVCNVVCKMGGVKPTRTSWKRTLAGVVALAAVVGLISGFVLLAGQAKQEAPQGRDEHLPRQQRGRGLGMHRDDQSGQWRDDAALLGIDIDNLFPVEPLDDRPPVGE